MVLVTGYAGQLGYDVVQELNKRCIECVGVDKSDFDITDSVATEQFIRKVMPEAVIHCSAYTAVDAAEENKELCRAVNVEGTANIARVCKAIGAKMLYISTDYVFSGDVFSSEQRIVNSEQLRKDGAEDYRQNPTALRSPTSRLPNGPGSTVHWTVSTKGAKNVEVFTSSPDTSNLTPRFYEVDDPTGPCNVYGQSKLDGELAVKEILDKYFIVRTSWVFGHHGKNFVETMLKLGREKESLNVVDDQVGSPTFTEDLARLIADMIVTDKYGTYHATNEGICSWAEFAAEIMRLAGLPCKINPISTAEYLSSTVQGRGTSEAGGRVACRPLNSRLSKKSLDEAGFQRLPRWQDVLKRYIGKVND